MPRRFPLQYTKYSCGKTACPARKILAVGHAPSFQIHPKPLLLFHAGEAVFVIYHRSRKSPPLGRGGLSGQTESSAPTFTADCAVQNRSAANRSPLWLFSFSTAKSFLRPYSDGISAKFTKSFKLRKKCLLFSSIDAIMSDMSFPRTLVFLAWTVRRK